MNDCIVVSVGDTEDAGEAGSRFAGFDKFRKGSFAFSSYDDVDFWELLKAFLRNSGEVLTPRDGQC